MSWCPSASFQFEPSTFRFDDANCRVPNASPCCACLPNGIFPNQSQAIYFDNRFLSEESQRRSSGDFFSSDKHLLPDVEQQRTDQSLSIARSHQPLFDRCQQAPVDTSERSQEQAKISYHINTGRSSTQNLSLTRRLANALSSIYKPFAYKNTSDTKNQPVLLNMPELRQLFRDLINQYTMTIDELEREIVHLSSQYYQK